MTRPDSAKASTGHHGAPRAVMACVALLAAGTVLLVLGARGADSPPQPKNAASSRVGSAASVPLAASGPKPPARPATGARRLGEFLPASTPIRIQIESIGLTSTRFVALNVRGDGTLSVPNDANEVGVYAAGPTPGQLGPAVLAAHVDTASGMKGIFYRLGAVEPGDNVRIARADGTTATFTVDKVRAYPKSKFPTLEVYRGDATRSQIRLITCGGPLERTNEYRDNIVVFGHLTSTRWRLPLAPPESAVINSRLAQG